MFKIGDRVRLKDFGEQEFTLISMEVDEKFALVETLGDKEAGISKTRFEVVVRELISIPGGENV